jgi:hypothetical protein
MEEDEDFAFYRELEEYVGLDQVRDKEKKKEHEEPSYHEIWRKERALEVIREEFFFFAGTMPTYTATCGSSCCYICGLMSLCMCPHATICVLILLYMRPHAAMYVSSCYYVSTYFYICGRMLLYVSSCCHRHVSFNSSLRPHTLVASGLIH